MAVPSITATARRAFARSARFLMRSGRFRPGPADRFLSSKIPGRRIVDQSHETVWFRYIRSRVHNSVCFEESVRNQMSVMHGACPRLSIHCFIICPFLDFQGQDLQCGELLRLISSHSLFGGNSYDIARCARIVVPRVCAIAHRSGGGRVLRASRPCASVAQAMRDLAQQGAMQGGEGMAPPTAGRPPKRLWLRQP